MTKKIEINGTAYVPMDMISGNFPFGVKRKEIFEKFGVLHHRIKEFIRPTFFRKGFLIITVLVPEKSYVEFYQYVLSGMEPKKEISLWEMFKVLKEINKSVEAFSHFSNEKKPKE